MVRLGARHVRVTRDSVMFSIGVAGIMFEATTGRNRPDLIAAYVTMISLSVALRGDDIRRRKNGG